MIAYVYDDGGNIRSATGVGTYSYPAGTAARPHAVTKIGNETITYDANGNMVSGRGRTIGWDGANRPAHIAMGNSRRVDKTDFRP